ncbi:hypothetical protein ACFSTI_02685 [Rhizorhabdus histidinilytica]
MLSTIEPRKNHLLLLHVWRRMAETLGPERTPHLAIVGRRGWENENVLDMLERCEAIRGHVHELAGLSDRGSPRCSATPARCCCRPLPKGSACRSPRR